MYRTNNVIRGEVSIALAFLLLLAAANVAAADDADFVDLLADESLAGWVADGANDEQRARQRSLWSMRDGLLHCDGKQYGFLRYDKELADFEFRVEYRMTKGCNSGIGIRCPVFSGGRSTRPSTGGYELQVLDDAGKKPHAHGSMALYRYLAPTENATRPHGEWNTLAVTCIGPKITVVLNGKTVHDVDQRDHKATKNKPLRGYVSLQNHSKQIDFRNVQLKELGQGQARELARQKKRPRGPLAQATEDPRLPRVLLIGDSISIGYTRDVRQLLADQANVQRPSANCGPTTRGLEQIGAWLGDGKWDVIHFNWGLHDLKYLGPKGENLADPANPDNHMQVPIEQYEKNLRQLVARLKKTGAQLVWCATTPVPQGAGGRVPGDSARYNEVAAKVMQEEGVAINDLFAFAKPRLNKIQRPKNVHFTPEGSKELALQVADAIRGALPKQADD